MKTETMNVSHPLVTSTIIFWMLLGIFWIAVYWWNHSPRGVVQPL